MVSSHFYLALCGKRLVMLGLKGGFCITDSAILVPTPFLNYNLLFSDY